MEQQNEIYDHLPGAEKLIEKRREQLDEKKKLETIEQTKERMKSVLSSRDAAMQAIYDYQDKTGIPTTDETEKNFFNVEAGQIKGD